MVSCPGFITLLHPKITNKRNLVESLTDIIRDIEINHEEETVKIWKKNNGSEGKGEGTIVPKFHIETNTRKWRDIQTEVLSLHCSNEDATYLKYLMSEVSSQGRMDHGVFIPTGIHLMEGKEVMYQLLKEQKDFVDRVTSFHLGGITYDEMHTMEHQSKSTKRLLLEAEGVWAIEQTYQTTYNGQWLLVVDKDKVQRLTDYITKNLQSIYRNKRGKTPKLVTYQVDRETYGYKLLLVDTITGKVGTYAEALKKRFPHLTQTGQIETQRHLPPSSQEKTKAGAVHFRVANKASVTKEHIAHSDQAPKGKTIAEQIRRTNYQEDRKVSSLLRSTNNASVRKLQERTSTPGVSKAIQMNTDTKQTDITELFKQKMDKFDQEWQAKIKELDTKNAQLMTKVNTTIEKRIDKMLDTKIKEISRTVSNSVTYRMVSAMKKIFPGITMYDEEEEEAHIEMCTDADSHQGHLITQANDGQQTHSNDINKQTQDTLMEEQIETPNERLQHTLPTDSHHDKQNIESSTTIK